MKRLKIFSLIFLFLWVASLTWAQNQKKEEKENSDVPEGMEVIHVTNGYRLIVPEGAKTRRIGAQIIVEGTKEYMSRRLHDMENRLTTLEKSQEDFKKTTLTKLNDMEVRLLQLEKIQDELKKEIKNLKDTFAQMPGPAR